MRSRSVRIDELRLRVPGMSAADARQLGERVAQRLAENPIGGGSRSIPSVSLRIRSSGADSVDHIAEMIAARLRQ